MSGARPVCVVIPVKDRLDLTCGIIGQLVAQRSHEAIFVYDNGSQAPTKRWLAERADEGAIELVDAGDMTIYQMWNDGAARARAQRPDCNIAFLNNDLVIGPRFLDRLAHALHADDTLWVVSPCYDGRSYDGIRRVSSTYRNNGLAGFAFMVRAEAFERAHFDDGFEWWYGDDDFVTQVTELGGCVGVVGDAWVHHIHGGSQTVRYTPRVLATIERDRQRMLEKWGHL